MAFTSSGFVKGLVLSLLFFGALAAGTRYFGLWGGPDTSDTPAVLARQASDAIEAVKRRQPGDRRPASYDAVLAPLDKLLEQAKAIIRDPAFNPEVDFEKIRARLAPVIDIATRADAQARTETGPLAKEYRFKEQKGEACQYLANVLWERLNLRFPRSDRPLVEKTPFPQTDLDEINQLLDKGIEADSGNKQLYYIRAVVERTEGVFTAAVRDLERALEIDPEFVAAWNTLGLIRIDLKQFDQAEEAFEKARTLALAEAKTSGVKPGGEYLAILYNLATFHEGLAVFYIRENRITPAAETQRLAERHVADARKYFEEYLSHIPSDSPDARQIRTRLNALPR